MSKKLKKERFIETKQRKQKGIGPPKQQTELSLLDLVVWDVCDPLKGLGQKLDGEVEQGQWMAAVGKGGGKMEPSKGKA